MTDDEIKNAVSDVNFGNCLERYVLLTKDSSAVSMVYRKVLWKINDGTEKEVFEYLSYAGIWMGSAMNIPASREKFSVMLNSPQFRRIQ